MVRALPVGTDPVAVAADHVAFRDLSQQVLATLRDAVSARDQERLRRRVTVIEVHDMRRVPLAAVSARNAAQLSEPLERRCLSRADTLDLLVTMGCVVADVVWPLRPCTGHVS